VLFNSFHFLLFFPLVVAGYYALPHKARWLVLLAASYYFYACWNINYLGLIIASTLIDYIAGIQITTTQSRSRKRLFLGLSIVTNLGLLFVFKYYAFATGSAQAILEQFNVFYAAPELGLLLPVGISFYTFQTLSYTIDVYNGLREPEYHLGYLAVYVSFFPQLVAGPIERSTSLLPQFRTEHTFNREQAIAGLRLALWGFFKKMVIADRLAYYVDSVYTCPSESSGWILLLATYFFAFQIYCDFSGYSDIAVGIAAVMGVRLMINFKQPYLAESLREFWSRWHISLSTWFRDYLYIPLGGNRVSVSNRYKNLFITFVVSGLWHGANWTFVIWGALHGIGLVLSQTTQGLRQSISRITGLDRYPTALALMRTFFIFHLVLLGWVFFRADSVGTAIDVITRVASAVADLPATAAIYAPVPILGADMLFVAVMVAVLMIHDWLEMKGITIMTNRYAIAVGSALQFWIIMTYGVLDE
jgi:alginate O-acetyltransferase complex protein AlgI